MGIAALAVGGLVGSYISSKGKQNAANKQAAATAQATADANALRQPSIDARNEALQGYQNLMTTEGQDDFTNNYMNSDLYQTQSLAAEDTLARNMSVTGARSGAGAAGFASIAPQLANTAYNQQLQGYGNLIDQGAASTENAANTLYSGGTAAANASYAADTSMTDFYGSAVSSLGGLGYNQSGGSKTYGR